MKAMRVLINVVLLLIPVGLFGQVNPNVTRKTRALYNNLKAMQSSGKFMFGQEFFNSFRFSSGSAHGDKTFSDSKSITGAHPAVLGSDFLYYLEKNSVERGYHTEAVKWAYQQGYVITFDWHLSARGTSSFNYSSSVANLATNIATNASSDDRAWYLGELDKVISIINSDLTVAGDTIPIVFRPWHEMNGNWFWWGTSAITAENFKALYRLTADYVKQRTKSVLFGWTPNTPFNLSYYPGDDYVDVLGLDYYEVNATSLQSQMATLVDYAQGHGKIAVLSETGNRVGTDDAGLYWKNTVLPALLNDPSGKSQKIAWVLTWINASWSYPYVPYSNSGSAAQLSFNDFKNSPNVLFGDEIPDMYSSNLIAAVEQTESADLQVYPVPSTGNLSVKLYNFKKQVKLIIYDITGKSVYDTETASDEVVLNTKEILKPGIYVLKANDGKRTASRKVQIN